MSEETVVRDETAMSEEMRMSEETSGGETTMSEVTATGEEATMRDATASPTRRRFLATTAGVALGAGLLARPAAAQGGGGVDLAAWFENTDGVGEVVDARGKSTVEIAVGAKGNGGAFAFDPAAVRVDPGTTVVWKWTGQGGTHNVAAENGAFTSDYYAEAGKTYEYTPKKTGVVPYACVPHKAMGMKGALVVGDAQVSLDGAGEGGAGNGTAGGDGAASDGEGSGEGKGEGDPARTFGGWLENTDNYDGVVDKRGENRVTVKVGAKGNGGEFAFEPAAVHVDPGTTVVWKWVGDAGAYDVVDETLGYHSERVAGPGHRFAMRFGGGGVSTYECETYGDRGMRGVVVIGDPNDRVISDAGKAALGGGALAFVAPLLYGLRLHAKNTTGPDHD